MRILFTTWAWPSHLYAMVPVAWACRARGHDVLVASQPGLTETIQRTGLPAAPVGHDVDVVPTFRDIALPAAASRPRGGPRVLRLLTSLAEAMVDDLIELARRWRPDLIVFEPTAFAGPLAAAALGVPAVRHLYGTDLLGAAGGFLADVLGPLRDRLGVDDLDAFGAVTVDPCPEGLGVPTGSRRLPMRYVPYNGSGVLPPELPRSPGRPRVCVTWGTTMSRLHPDLFLSGPVVRALGELDVDVVVAATPGQLDLLGPLPPRAQVVESVPLHLLLPTCDAVVAHGGAGTLLTALAHGLPQLLVPRLPDHVRHAGRLAEAGAGVVLDASSADAAAIGSGLTELLATPAYRTAATRLRDAMLDAPPPTEIVRELEHIAAGALAGS
jgi:UDP:flavonoid glycosyltransferase YjiC (YdhE family)